MSTAYRILGIAAIFVLVTIGAVFATDALTSDGDSDATSTTVVATTVETAPDSSTVTVVVDDTDVTAAKPVFVVPAYYIDISSDAQDPLPPPEADPDAAAQDAGIQVLRPPSGEPTDHPETEEQPFDFDVGPVPIEDIEAEAAEQQADEPSVEELIPTEDVPDGVRAAIAGRPIQLPVRFADPCSLFVEGACPVGIPAIVVIGAPQLELQLGANVRRGEVGKTADGTESCQEGFVEGEFNIWIATTIPSRIDIQYRQSLPQGSHTQITQLAPGPGDPEYDRWVEYQSNGEFDDVNVWTWFRTCMVLDLEPDVFYEFDPITVTSPDGQVVTYPRPRTLSTVTPGETIGKPPPTFVFGDDSHLIVHVWKKSRAEGHRAYVWPIDLSDPDAPSCSDVEADVFVEGGHIGTSHPDFRVAAVPRDSHPATPHEIYDSEYTELQRFDMDLREGRTYTLCVWETRLGTASFDEWEILGRDQYDVVTPNSHPIVMNLVRAGVRGGSSPHDIHVYAENHDYCDSRGPVLNATVEDVGEGTRIVREVFCESWGLPLDDFAFTRITVDNQLADVLAIPLDGLTNCGPGSADPACAIRVSEYITHTVEVPGSCDDDCAWADLKFRLDYLPSNGQGSESWGVGPAGTFVGMEPREVAGPDVDIFSMTLDPVDDRVDQMKATFVLKSPSDYVIKAVATVPDRDGDESCNSTNSGSGEGLVEVIFEGMCADNQYALTSIVLTDAEGNTTERDLRGTVAPVWTNGYASFFRTNVFMTFLDEQAAAARCAEADSQSGFSRGADEDCWNHLGVANDSPVTIGGAQVYPLQFPGCVSPNGSASALFAAPPVAGNPPPSRAIVVGDLVAIDFQFAVYVLPDCGSGGRSPAIFELLEIHRDEPLESLNPDLIYTFPVDDGIEWQVRVRRTDAGIANRRP